MKAKLTEKLIKALRPKAKRYDVYDEVLRGLLLRVETGGTKTYYLKYRTATRAQRMLKLGRTMDITLAEAREDGTRHRAEIALGKDPAEERRKQRQGLTLGAFLEDVYDVCGGYFESVAALQRSAAGVYARHRVGRSTDVILVRQGSFVVLLLSRATPRGTGSPR